VIGAISQRDVIQITAVFGFSEQRFSALLPSSKADIPLPEGAIA
jgi:hypothetical protein